MPNIGNKVIITNCHYFPRLRGFTGNIERIFEYNRNTFYTIKATNSDPHIIKETTTQKKAWKEGDHTSRLLEEFVILT